MSTIQLERVELQVAEIEIVGKNLLIAHNWSDKAKREMLEKQQGKKTQVKKFKDPEADFQASRYKFEDGSGDGFPVTGFKLATIRGGQRAFGKKTVVQTELKQNLLFIEDGYCSNGMPLARLRGADPVMREDMVRISGGTADIRYRAEYREWSAVLNISYNASYISLDSLVALVDAGGANGIGEWRPEKGGDFGTYEVVV